VEENIEKTPRKKWIIQCIREFEYNNTKEKIVDKAEIILKDNHLILSWLPNKIEAKYERIK